MIKKPTLFGDRREGQKLLDAGVNIFALDLLAESLGDKPETLGDRTIMLRGITHRGSDIWVIISAEKPEQEQFKDWPE